MKQQYLANISNGGKIPEKKSVAGHGRKVKK
jgi:hypothetical protein